MSLPPDTVHFPASLPYNYCAPLIQVGALIEQGQNQAAFEAMVANIDEVGAALGAVDYWRKQYNAPPSGNPVATLSPNGVPSAPFAIAVGEVKYAQCTAPGLFTWAPGGSPQVWASTDPSFPSDPAKTQWGAGTCQLRIAAAGPVYIKVTDGGPYQAATCSLNP